MNANLPAVVQAETLEDLAGVNPHIAVLVDAGSGPIQAHVKELAKFHTRLPYRLLVATERRQEWKSELDAANSDVPSRRVALVGRSVADSGDFLATYSEWLQAFRPPPLAASGSPGRWWLVVGLDRPAGSYSNCWELLNNFESNLLDVCILSKSGPTRPDARSANFPRVESAAAWNNLLGANLSRLVLFDNHGRALGLVQAADASAHYSEIGLSSSAATLPLSLSFFQQLESPPTTKFAFHFFLLSLLEASLTRIAVLDERLVSCFVSEVESSNFSNLKYAALTNAGILPILGLSFEEERPQFVLERLSRINALTDYATLAWKNSSWNLNWVGDPAWKPRFKQIDMLIVHEGLVTGRARSLWPEDREKSLFGICPRFIVTSGSGGVRLQRARSVPPPFLEFSVLSSFTYEGLDKLALARSALAASGETRLGHNE